MQALCTNSAYRTQGASAYWVPQKNLRGDHTNTLHRLTVSGRSAMLRLPLCKHAGEDPSTSDAETSLDIIRQHQKSFSHTTISVWQSRLLAGKEERCICLPPPWRCGVILIVMVLFAGPTSRNESSRRHASWSSPTTSTAMPVQTGGRYGRHRFRLWLLPSAGSCPPGTRVLDHFDG